MEQGDAADGQVEVGHLGAKPSEVPRDVLELTEHETGLIVTYCKMKINRERLHGSNTVHHV